MKKLILILCLIFAGEIAYSQQLKSFINSKVKTKTNPAGNVLEVRFMMPKNTLVTAEELEKLETVLKQDVKFKLSAPNLEKGDFYEIFQNVRYASLLK